MQFSFKVKKKLTYERGVVVIGKVLSGIILNDNDVIVAVGNNEYNAHIDSIIDKPDGGYVQSCSIGNNVSLYLSGIDEQIVKPRITLVRNKAVDTSTPIDLSRKRTKESKVPKNKQKKTSKEDVHKKVQISRKIIKDDYSSIEKDFIQDVSVCIKRNGKLAPTELYVLDKIRSVYNITEERARQLIFSTIKRYDKEKNEIIYRDAVSACLLDCGYLTATESYLLEKLRIALNIPECKAYTIEKESDWDV